MTADAPSAPAVGERGLVVVVVEDDDGDALLVTELLQIGLPAVSVVRARDLAEAELALAGPADCVLLDLGLPDATGTDAVERLLDARPGVAVVVVTGADDARMGVTAVARGAQDFLVKDQLDEAVLTRSVLYAIERRRAEESTLRLFEAERQRADNARMERALLPTPILHSAGTALAVAYRPGNHGATLGGDFYDAIEMSTGHLRVVMGDVSGHGPDEAALGATLRSAWRALVLAGFPTESVLRTVDRMLRTERLHAHTFVTLCMLDVEPDHRRLSVTLAGHPAPVLLADADASAVGEATRGPLLGVVDDASWHPTVVDLPSAWSVLLYTDGLIEGRARPGAAERLGEERARELAVRLCTDGVGGTELVNALVADVESLNGGPLTDDVAVCLVDGSWR